MKIRIKIRGGEEKELDYPGTLDDLEQSLKESTGCNTILKRFGEVFISVRDIEFITGNPDGKSLR